MEGFIKRYTELPFVLNILQAQKLTLLNPASWDDKNDIYHLLDYQKRQDIKSILALCFSLSSETYHHWHVFSSGHSGACIDFKKDKFLAWADQTPGLQYGEVQYKRIDEIRSIPPLPDQMPFIKRHAFRDEKEARLIHESYHERLLFKDFDFDLSMVSKITLSPWLPKAIAESIRGIIRNLPGCSNMRVTATTLIENEEWKRLAHRET